MKVTFLSLFALLMSLTAYSQQKSIEVTYIKAYKNFKDTSDIVPRPLKNLEYRLYCSPVASRFEKISPIMTGNDNSIYYKVEQFSRFLYRDISSGIHYKNTQGKIKLHQTEFADSIFLIKENYNQYTWELKNDKKEILGFKCYKAEGSYREYSNIFKRLMNVRVTVWYAPNIPFPFGPSGYDGLPGLVLAADMGGFHYVATGITFCPDKAIIQPPNKGKKLNRKEYNKAIYKMYQQYTRKQ